MLGLHNTDYGMIIGGIVNLTISKPFPQFQELKVIYLVVRSLVEKLFLTVRYRFQQHRS